jgi:hypothetical protein
MKQIIVCFVILFNIISCKSERVLTGKKDNGTNYVLAIQQNNDSPGYATIHADIRAVGSPLGEKVASLHLISKAEGKKLIHPAQDGNFTFRVAPGEYHLTFFAVGFGATDTKRFILRNGDSATLKASIYPEVISIDN